MTHLFKQHSGPRFTGVNPRVLLWDFPTTSPKRHAHTVSTTAVKQISQQPPLPRLFLIPPT